MSKEMKILPALRFLEFENEGEWKTDSLGNLVEIKGRIGYRGYTRADIVEEGKGAITLSPSNFEDSGSLNFEKCTYITWEKYEESPEIMLEEGQTVLVKTASVGKSAYVKELPEKATINPQIVVLKPQKIEPKFLAYSIFHNYVQVQIKGAVGAGAIPNMSQDSISKFDILLPPDKKGIEQQKIAACLSSLDELIAAHKDKLDALKDHKKGLLQNLFPQEGETVPKVRFPEFEEDGEWVEETIDSVSLLVTDYVANGSFQSLRENVNVSNQKGYAYYVRLVDLRAGLGHTDQKFVDQSSYQFLGKSSLNGGELLMANIGANVGEVWQMPIVDYPATLAPNMLMIKFESQTTTDFVFQFLQSGYGQRNLSLAISGSGHPKINKTDLKQVNVGIPPTRDEQQKIASCLSAVDELITAQQDKIDELQQHKKGLMQGLFPKMTD